MREERPFVICSNTNAAHWDYLNKRYRLGELALAAILSHEVECGEKPSAEIYFRAAAAHGAHPDDCLFVDDVVANIVAAKTLGFHTHRFTEFEPFREALESSERSQDFFTRGPDQRCTEFAIVESARVTA